MSRPEVMLDWAARHGIERSKWTEAYNSPETTRRIERARQLTREYDIQGTPSIVVDGKYLTSSGLTDDVAFVMPVVDYLVKRARRAREEVAAWRGARRG